MSAPLPHVLTILAGAEADDIAPALLSELFRLLPGASGPAWLDPGRAIDVAFEAAPQRVEALASAVSGLITGLALDAVFQPREGRRKALLVADMDSTMIGQECIDELASHAGLKPAVAAITDRAMRGEIAFEPALRERVALLRGLPVAAIEQVLAERITPTPGAATLVRTLRANGAYCALVSGGFTAFTGPVAARLGFDEHRANTLEVDGDRLRGTVTAPILGRAAKRDRLVALRRELSLAPEATLAVGDGANDLDMLDEAGLGIAFRAKPAVAEAADARIDHGDLHALLFIQGYSRSDFVS